MRKKKNKGEVGWMEGITYQMYKGEVDEGVRDRMLRKEQRLSTDKELRILWKLCLGLEENVKSVKKYVKRVETARYQQKNTQPQARVFTEFTDKNISDDIPKDFVDIDGKLHKFEYNPEKKDWEVDTRRIVPPSFYKELKKHKYNMKKYIKSKLIKLTTK